MNFDDHDLIERLHQVAAGFEMPTAALADDVRRGRRRVHRNRALATGAAAAAVALVLGITTALGGQDSAGPAPVEPPGPTPEVTPAAPGWVAVDADQGGGSIYLVRPGVEARRLEVAGSDSASDACPAWSPDGTRLMFGRVTGSSGAELVIVPVVSDGAIGAPEVIGLDGFDVLEGFDPHPCGVWAPDGRWVALAGTGEVSVVDTQTGSIRHLPDLRPSDLEWRPGTDELTIAGDMGTDRGANTVSTTVTVYSVSTGELRQLGSVEAAHLTWSPDGTTLAYTPGEDRAPELRLVDADGGDDRVLVAHPGSASHGIGPVWSPAGDRIVYQRLIGSESHEVVLVDVTNGAERTIEPPETHGRSWYPYTVSWSPDGTTLLYAAWSVGGTAPPSGVLAVPADKPGDLTVLIDGISPSAGDYSHRWSPVQMWGRQPG